MRSKVIIIFIIILCISCSKSLCPLKEGYLLNKEVHSYEISDSFYNVYIRSLGSDKVYSFSAGKVEKVLQNDDGNYMVFVSSENDTSNFKYVYSNLNEVFVNVGDKINHHKILGSLNLEKNESEYILIFSMLKGTEKVDPRLYLKCKNLEKQKTR